MALDTTEKPCVVCAKPIPATARKCTLCNNWQDDDYCVVCGAGIAKDAQRCTVCQSNQRRFGNFFSVSQVTLALILSILSVIGALGDRFFAIWNDRSRTSVHFAGAQAVDDGSGTEVLVIEARNAGNRPSWVVGATLRFGDVPLQDVQLQPAGAVEREIEPNKMQRLTFNTASIPTRRTAMLADVKRLMPVSTGITIEVEVDEKTWTGGVSRVSRIDRCNSRDLIQWVNRYAYDEKATKTAEQR